MDQSIDTFIDAVLEREAEMLQSGNFIGDDSKTTVLLDVALPKCTPTSHTLQVSKEIHCKTVHILSSKDEAAFPIIHMPYLESALRSSPTKGTDCMLVDCSAAQQSTCTLGFPK